MHPNPSFRWTDEGAMLAFISRISFATICVDGPALIHVPVAVSEPDRLLFHVARANPAAAWLDGARAVASVLGPDAYISPDWYGTPDQVPTWNYVAVEAEGPLGRLDRAELIDLLDALSAAHEERLAPKRPWTRAKITPGRFEAMLNGIAGFELRIDVLRGTRKFGQHKSLIEIEAVASALAAQGRSEMAEMTLQAVGARQQ